MLIEAEEFEEALTQATGVDQVYVQRESRIWQVD